VPSTAGIGVWAISFRTDTGSIVVEEESYLLDWSRYVHLNPLRAKVVPDLRTLDRYPWTGHSALLGTVPRAWQEIETIPRPIRPNQAAGAGGLPRIRGSWGRAKAGGPELQGGASYGVRAAGVSLRHCGGKRTP